MSVIENGAFELVVPSDFNLHTAKTLIHLADVAVHSLDTDRDQLETAMEAIDQIYSQHGAVIDEPLVLATVPTDAVADKTLQGYLQSIPRMDHREYNQLDVYSFPHSEVEHKHVWARVYRSPEPYGDKTLAAEDVIYSLTRSFSRPRD